MASPLTIRFDVATRERIAREAKRKKVPVSDIVRDAVESYFSKKESTETFYDQISDLIGTVRGGDPNRSTDGGRKFAAYLKERHRNRK
jgi:replication-associated recombination protein RarA